MTIRCCLCIIIKCVFNKYGSDAYIALFSIQPGVILKNKFYNNTRHKEDRMRRTFYFIYKYNCCINSSGVIEFIFILYLNTHTHKYHFKVFPFSFLDIIIIITTYVCM